jgi:hypothetical protein
VHLCIILVGNQLDAQFFCNTFIYLFESSTCFEQLCAYPQEDSCMNTISGIITSSQPAYRPVTNTAVPSRPAYWTVTNAE